MKEMREIGINAKLAFFLFIAVIGILFYLLWSIHYGAWTDIGIYSITIILVCIGVLGTAYSWIEKRS